ncbi:response regulator [Nostoc sp. FACHB-280]|uniref:response regulator n=1 Tax=Nostoc sp. FACHB-280 TaxID=2692839 RepID=UPI00168A9A7C|nr:response regulator [Nostoc sp. FACHB-280]MBD2494136.1 response regulator [Nostoc sp. FACHB-280]
MSLSRLTIDSALILLIDDTPDNLRLLAKILENHGFKVKKTVSGKIAIQAAQIEPPDLILLDINMPEINGYEVCQQLKLYPKTANIPIIFISALDQITDKIKAFELGGVDYITKPFQESEVLARVQNQLIIYEQRKMLLAQNQRLQQEIQERQQAQAALQELNQCFEQQIIQRTAELQRSLEFEARLKRITDIVRDSLDEKNIWQAAVAELVVGLELDCCYATICNNDLKTCVVAYEYHKNSENDCVINCIKQIKTWVEFPATMRTKHSTQFCWYFLNDKQEIERKYAILLCQIFDNQKTLGSLWLFKSAAKAFDELEIRLVKQLANQCAIALRQARLYQAVQAQVEELQKLNQLKDDFLCSISHELRNPIANIQSFIQLLETELTSLNYHNPKILQYLAILHEECQGELQLIQDLLDLQYLNAEFYPLQFTTINLGDWIPYTIEVFIIQSQQQHQNVQIQLPPDLPLLTTDISSLSRILRELVKNACKYTPAGETITITAFHQNDHLHLCVINSGVEIPEAELSRIFDKFYRIPNIGHLTSGGTGLGLALVKKLVEHLGGSIFVKSRPREICFTLVLPLLTECNYRGERV